MISIVSPITGMPWVFDANDLPNEIFLPCRDSEGNWWLRKFTPVRQSITLEDLKLLREMRVGW